MLNRCVCLLALILTLPACAHHATRVECEGALRPINPPAPAVAVTPPRPASSTTQPGAPGGRAQP